ncbi:serine/threonine protein phosphatase [Akkermansiaceae bacterium]|nr:serine/threonine protein phosphatase [Akkermansiaceae bacterium]
MRTLAIGDIHGCLNALKELVEKVNLQPQDTLITLGDYVDRGTHSKGVIDYLIELREKCNLITLQGNHEELMDKAFSESEMDMMMWFNVGGLATMYSYQREADIPEVPEIPEAHWDFIDACLPYHETDTHIFVHGGLKPEVDIESQELNDLLWLRFDELKAHKSGKIIVCGHTPQRDHKINDKGYAICIDTHVFAGGFLSCLDVDSGEVWQAKESEE